MRKIDFTAITENFIDTIGNEWMLITAGNEEKFNTMTANWGGIGYLWNKPVVFVFVRPERYTYSFIKDQKRFTLSFLGEEHKDIHKICGTKSGRETDKIKESGLTPITLNSGNITFEQSRLSLECEILYEDVIRKEKFLDSSIFEKWYTTKGQPHQIFVAEIVACWAKEE